MKKAFLPSLSLPFPLTKFSYFDYSMITSLIAPIEFGNTIQAVGNIVTPLINQAGDLLPDFAALIIKETIRDSVTGGLLIILGTFVAKIIRSGE